MTFVSVGFQWAAVVKVVDIVVVVVVVFANHWQDAQPHSELVQVGQAEKVCKFFDLEKEMSMSIRGHTTKNS